MTAYTIHPIVMGTKVFDKSMMTYQHDSGQKYTIPIYCWYLEGGDKKILVDTGEMHPLQSAEREEAIGGKIYTFEEGLAKWNLKPEDIDVVIHTHLHADHCENDYKCINARFYIHENEMETIASPHPLDFRYVEDYIHEIRERDQIELICEDQEILPGISVIHTPVHTRGGLTIFVNTAKGITAITGFCIIEENLEPPAKIKAMEMEIIPPGTNVDPYAAYDLMLQVKKAADYIIPLHEPKFAGLESI